MTFTGWPTQFVAPADDGEGVARIRSLGRKAGRQLGWKIKTLPIPRDSGETTVFVVVEESNALHEESLRVRGEKKFRTAWASLLDDGLGRIGAPVALAGVLIAMVVFLPESLTSVRAALSGEAQRVSNH